MNINLPDFRMAYDDQGRGIPLLCVHGYPLNRSLWTPQLRDLADDARVMAVDLRGHGESDAPPAPYDLDQMADDLCYFLDRMGIDEKIVLCGLSMGGYLALAFWRRYASRLAGLILVATRAGADSAETKAKRDEAAAQARRDGIGPIIEAMLPKLLTPANNDRPHLVQRVQDMIASTSLNGVLGDLAAMRDRPDSTPLLGQIAVPTLIIHGAGDPLIPVSEAQLMAERIPDSQLEIIPNAGHLPNLEQPELFNRYVRGFLQRLPEEDTP